MKTNLLVLLFFCFPVLNAQFDVPKFGKIEKTDVEMIKYESDTSAKALMIFDDGLSEFKISREKSFQFVFNRHYKLKILKQSALDMANIEIRLYRNNTKKEVLSDFRAIIYNLENGDITKTKFGEKDILESPGKNYTDYKCALPAVKTGSVIEVSYQIISDFLYDFRGWQFQFSYPVLLSQYKYIVPEYFDYRKSSRGYLQFEFNKTSDIIASYTTQSESIIDPMDGGKTSSSGSTLRIPAKSSVLAMKNVPAFVLEPYMDNEINYIQAVEFELSSIQYPGERRTDYTSSWEAVNTQMIESEEFGALLKNNGFIKDQVSLICSNAANDFEKAVKIYNHVQSLMKWDEKKSLWALKGLKKPYEDKIGNSSEINLMLTLMLKTAAISAYPVIISTRDNGISNSLFPSITKYNSVIVITSIGDKKYLLDATSKFCPFGVIPANDINGKGRLVNDLTGDWVDVMPADKYAIDKKYILTVNEEGEFIGSVSESFDGYAGIAVRNKIGIEKTTDNYVLKLQERTPGLSISNSVFQNIGDIYKPIKDSLNISLSDHSEVIGNKLMFRPLLAEGLVKNPYTLEDRQYPVNYNFPFSEKYIFEYTIPEGFGIESIPQNITLQMPENSLLMEIKYNKVNNKIIVYYSFEISKIIFNPTEYKTLKNLYNEIVKAHSNQIILVKK